MIRVEAVSKTFPAVSGGPSTPALDRLDFTIAAREFVCLVGPSGCGKTTLLRMIAGLVVPDSGRITIDGAAVTGPGPDRAMVFQHATLLPWADVLTNVAFGLELRGRSRDERETAARQLLQTVGLGEFERHYPHQLSGGMQQRVGLARALAVEPGILLMDEPFAAVDAQTRRSLQDELRRLHASTRKTVVFVTHDIDEAVRLGDRVLLMTPRPGRIQEAVDVAGSRSRAADTEADAGTLRLKTHLWRQLRAGPS
jgi:NitT/TauT family transport system ATP-binding protein